MVRIEVDAAGARSQHDYAGDGPLVVGRQVGCDLRIGHTDVSRRHLVIEPDPAGGFSLRDLRSRNGTRLEGRTIGVAPVPLVTGQTVHLSPEVRLIFGSAAAPGLAGRAGGAGSNEASLEAVRQTGPAPAPASAPAPAPASAPASAPTPPADTADGPTRRARRRRRAAGSAARTRTVLVYLSLAAALLAFAWWVERALSGSSPSSDEPRTQAAPDQTAPPGARLRALRSLPESTSSQRRGHPSGAAEATSGEERAWARLQGTADLDAELRLAALRAFAARYPRGHHAAEARAAARVLQAVLRTEPTPDATSTRRLTAEVDRLLGAGRFLSAHALLEVAPRLGLCSEASAARLRARVEDRAYLRFGAARDRARALAGRGRPLAALTGLWAEAGSLRTLRFGSEVTAELDALERRAATGGSRVPASGPGGPSVPAGPAPDVLLARARTALLRFDFDGALDSLRVLLGQPLAAQQNAEVLWRLYDVERARRLFRAMLVYVAQPHGPDHPPLRLRVTQAWHGEVVQADASGLRVEVEIPGETNRAVIEKRWRALAPHALLEILSGLPPDGDGLLSLAALAFELGLEGDAHRALTQIFTSWPAFQPAAAALLARRTGVSSAPEDLVAFEGRLVPRAERDRIVARRLAEKQRAAALREELKAARREDRLAGAYDRALGLLQAGSYEDGRAVLAEIAKRLAGRPLGKRAAKRATDVFLRRRRLPYDERDLVRAPETPLDKNRVAIFFLGEGYRAQDREQRAFDAAASRAYVILRTQEPWREYASWFRYYEVNVASGEAGVDRQPGDVEKDTPFDGGVRDGVYAVSGPKVLALLDRRFPGPKIGVVVGNAVASVATGGGGVCAVSKGMLEVTGHEIGHAFCGLGDEYSSDPTGKPGPPRRAAGVVAARVIGPNLVAGNRRDEMRKIAPWRHWFALSGQNWTRRPVDLFEGGNRVPFDVWRPQVGCKMRTSGSRFCAVCMERMVLTLHERVRMIDERSPKEDRVEAKRGARVTLRISTLKPRTHALEVSFALRRLGADGEETTGRDGDKARSLAYRGIEVPDGRIVFAARTPALETGRYRVEATVKDPTPWVQLPDRSGLRHRTAWTITVSP